ncbi:cholinesterase precursor [Podospora fimiseda]|uniref:Carboxylic ester hydrolase n=1 Tax=Podospora fimiseda TaxID=252190 RepID=A0AAN7BJ65_9PEZI|nr:cholinesterase precursor [Podospora fimiseda]
MISTLLLLASTVWAKTAPSTSCRAVNDKHALVRTSSGLLKGHPAPNSECVLEFLGVPYAKPPVGDLRFCPPEKILNPKRTFDAAAFGYDCPLTPSNPVDYPGFSPQAQKIVDYFTSSTGTAQSEDCLTLNVWAKPPFNAAKPKPILVFFYGGRFTIGNTNTPFYNGKYFADAEKIVVVTANYRLNVFGFPGAPGETQNLGLRDQRAAVEWVRENIAGFGGDPSKITIGGQSSGGVAVDYWAYAYEKDPIAHGIIAHSGTVFSFPANTKAVQEANWNTVVAAINCSGNTDETMACMRKADWKALKSAAASIRSGRSNSVLRGIPSFWPTPDEDIVFSDYVGLTANGSFAKIPILLGNTHTENGYYQVPAYAQGVIPTEDQVRDFMLQSFTCPVAYQAKARRDHGVPSYVFRYFADWENTRLYPTSGAYHGVDMHMIFGGSADVSGLPASTEQRRLTRLMQRLWFSFANNPESGLEKLGWPRYDPGGKTLVELGLDNKAEVKLAFPYEYDAPCSEITMS